VERLLAQSGPILCSPVVGFDVVAARSIDGFHGQDPVRCERTEDVWCRDERGPVVEREIDEEVGGRVNSSVMKRAASNSLASRAPSSR
jgi:hypothetical protein